MVIFIIDYILRLNNNKSFFWVLILVLPIYESHSKYISNQINKWMNREMKDPPFQFISYLSLCDNMTFLDYHFNPICIQV